jgi:putative SOS response-associated peptidase YedK
MCRYKGYTAEHEEHRARWYAQQNERNEQDDNDSNINNYYATAYLQPALTAGIPIILRDKEGYNLSTDAFWGILPPWKHTFKEAVTAANSFVNIRSETVYESKLYTPLLKKKQRCLIPCSYYFEHHHFDKYNKKTGEPLKGKVSVPFFVKMHRTSLFAVPALYSKWYDKENKREIITYSMFTIVANDLLTAIHNGGDNPYRMPLVIEREMEDVWLNPDSSDRQINEILNYQVHSDQLRAYAVAPLTGKAAKQGEDVIKEEDWDEYKAEIEEIKNTGKTRIPELV